MRLTRWTADDMLVQDGLYCLLGGDHLSYDLTKVINELLNGNGLAGACPEAVLVAAGTGHGAIRLTAEQRQDAPPLPGDAWQAAVEVSVRSTTGELWLTPVYGNAIGEAGNFAVAGVGWYRVRVQARGRSEGRDGSGVEEHALFVWPAPPEPDRVLVVEDEARGHHGGHRRPYGGDPDLAPAEPLRPGDPAWDTRYELRPELLMPKPAEYPPRRGTTSSPDFSEADRANLEALRRSHYDSSVSEAANVRRRRIRPLMNIKRRHLRSTGERDELA